MRYLPLLLLLVFASLSFCLSRSDFYYDASESFSDWGHGCQVYYVDASDSVADATLARPAATITTNKANSTISKTGWEIYTSINKTRQVWTPDIVCSRQDVPCDPKNVTGNQTCDSKTNTTKEEVCEDKGSYKIEAYSENDWLPMNLSQKFLKGEKTKVRYCADYQMKPLSTGGWGASIDVIPSFNGYSYPEYAWWNVSWSYRAPCYVNTTVASSLTNFPAHCIINTSALITTGKMNTSCQDLRVANSSDNALNYEIEASTCNTTTTVVWVSVPTTTASGNDTIYIYYGGGTVADGQNASAVWSNNYLVVMHFSSLVESSGKQGAVTTTTSNVTGMWGLAHNTSGSKSTSVAVVTTTKVATWTSSVWFKSNSISQTNTYLLDYADNSVPSMLYEYTDNQMECWPGTCRGNSSTAVSDLNWHNIVYAYNGSAGWVANNGGLVLYNSSLPTMSSGTSYAVIYFGRSRLGDYSTAVFDEYRFSNITRTSDWVLAEYAQTDSIGAEEICNLAPVVVSLNLTPTTAYTETNLVAAFTINDSDSALLNATVYWYKNGALQDDLNVTFTNMVANSSNSTTLSNTLTSQGENWSFAVNATDGLASSALNFSSNVTILNRAPNATSINISMSPPYHAVPIYCNFTIEDNDLDAISFNVSFYKNEVYNSSQTGSGQANGTALAVALTAINTGGINDVWLCQIDVYDSWDHTIQNSSNITVQNNLPYSNLTLSPGSPHTDDALVCEFQVYDADSDLMNATIYWYKNGTLQPTLNESFTTLNDSSTGNSTLGIGNTTQLQNWSCSMNLSDYSTATAGYFNTTSNATSNVTILNRAPSASGLALSPTPNALDSENLTCSFIAVDNDRDTMTVNTSFYRNGTLVYMANHTGVTNGSTISDVLGAGNTTTGDRFTCGARLYDTFDTTAQNITYYTDIVTFNFSVTPSVVNDYETSAGAINLTLLGTGGNITAYNISVYYNNTLKLSDAVTGINTNVVYRTVPFVAPLVAANGTNISYNYTVDALVGGYSFNRNATANQTLYLWYTIDRYVLSKAVNYTVEDQNNFTVSLPNRPVNATSNVSYTPMYAIAYCTGMYANGTVYGNYTYLMNTTCNTSITTTNLSYFVIPASHNQITALIYQDYFINRSMALSFAASTESTSGKGISVNNTNVSREYFVWLVDYTSGTIPRAPNLSNVMYVRFYNEDTLAQIYIDSAVATYTVDFPDGHSKTFTLSQSGSGTVYNNTVRGYPNMTNITISSIEQYVKSTYTTRSRFMTDAVTPLNVQQNISVYMLPDASASYAIINVVDNGAAVPNAVVRIMKYYSVSSTYTVVDEKITNGEGRAFAYLDVSGYYKFQVVENGQEVYFSTGPEQFICDDTCELTINIGDQIPISFISPQANAVCYGVNATNTIVFDYADGTGLTSSVNFLAYRENVSTPVCNYTVSAASSSYICALSGGENLSQYLYSCEVWHSASPATLDFVDLIDFRLYNAIVDWIMPALILVTTLGVSAAHLPLGIGLGSVALFAMSIMGIVAIPVGVSMPIMIVGLVIAFLLSKRGAD